MAKKIDRVDIVRFFFIMLGFWFCVGTYLTTGIDWLIMNGENDGYILVRFIILVCFFGSNILYWAYIRVLDE
jgi:hypothetical protein